MPTLRKKHYTKITLMAISFLCVACRSNYQAPVSDQSEKLVVSAPLVIDSSSADNSFIVQKRGVRTPDTNISLGRVHRVQRGDNLISIAFQYDLDFRTLAIANGLEPPYTIFVDQEINLDINRISDDQTKRNGRLGVEVSNSSIARAQGASSRVGGLIRESIYSNREPSWQWPSLGEVLRHFQVNQNKGIDISGQVGDPVVAASSGDVVYSGRSVQGIGNLIIIRHNDKYLSAYAYNSKMLVDEGSKVNAGEKIAEVGLNANGIAMLHFEIRIDGKPANPTILLPTR